MNYIQEKLLKYIFNKSSDWLYVTTANLGDFNGIVNSTTAGLVYARLSNGQVIEVYNNVAPSRFDTHVKIGQNKYQPGLWQVIEVREVYSAPAMGFIRNHKQQHELGADDMLPVSREQIMKLTVFAHPNLPFTVKLFGANIITLAGAVIVENQLIDLTAYVPATGAVYINIECSSTNGAISINTGTAFQDPNLPLPAYIPVPAAGKNRLASVLLYDSMDKLLQRHITVPMPIESNPLDFATVVNSYLDTDGTLAANSDVKIATQKATKTYANSVSSNAAVIAKLLTGFTAGAGTVSASDTILQAFQKVVGNIALKLTANALITAATKTKITYDANGLVTAGADIAASDLPSGIDAAKIGAGAVSNTEFGYVDGVTSAIQTQLDGKQASGTYIKADGSVAFSADQSLASHKLTNLTDPSAAQDAATKNYVDAVAQGLSAKPSAVVATTTTLPAYTYSSSVITATTTGVLTIDGHVVALNEYILVKDEVSGNAPYNGLYKCTTAGAVGVAYVLTRAVEMDAGTEFSGAFVFIEIGTVNAASGWVCTNSTSVTVGVTNITFTQFSGAGEITAGAALTKTGNTLDVAVDDSTIEVSADALRVKDAGITLAKQANMATASLVYRKTASSGVPEINTLATLKTDLLLTGTNSGDQTITLTSEATGSGVGSFVVTLLNSAVIGKLITGFVSGAGTVAATDTILQAFNKIVGNIALKLTSNVAITAATKTKITYDVNGLVTVGADATTADIAASTNKNYVTDAQQTVIGNTSGTNTGDSATPAETATTIGALINGATVKATPVDADRFGFADSAASFVLKYFTWANLKSVLKTYFDTLYPSGSGTSSGTNTGDQTSVTGNAGTATALQTARNIDGQAFDGTANITVIAPGTHAATSKTTPVDADELPLIDSAASNVLKRLTWANLKATLKTYFDTLYPSGSGTSSGTNTGNETASTIGTLINAAAAATPNDTDLVATAESSVLKKITWTNTKAFLKTYFDTLYAPIVTAIPNSGWVEVTGTWTFASASTITIPTDGTTVYQKGMKIRFKQGGAYKYYLVSIVAATLITIYVNTDYTVANATITNIAYSFIDNPLSYPKSFRYTPTYSGTTSGTPTVTTTTAKYAPVGGGSMVLFLDVTITNVNGAVGSLRISFPWDASVGAGTGRENVSTGSQLQVQVQANGVVPLTYNNATTLVLNYNIILEVISDF